jgi:hypothetical protein
MRSFIALQEVVATSSPDNQVGLCTPRPAAAQEQAPTSSTLALEFRRHEIQGTRRWIATAVVKSAEALQSIRRQGHSLEVELLFKELYDVQETIYLCGLCLL